mgnify:CR=1 FL=1
MKTRKLKAMSKNKIILLVLSFLMTSIWNTYAQVATVSGVVQDKSGETIIGANVLVKGTANGAITDLNGKFTISGVSTNGTLVVTYIGYVSKEIAVKNQTNFIITLEEDSRALEEVVVIGYQTVKRKDLTGSVASVSGKQIAAMPVANAAQALQGKLSGVNVTTQDGRPDATVSIRVRGGGSISQSNDPLVLIDGVSGSLNDISADLIESIDVLKDASSTAIYGARGANGVILVTTKGAKEGRVVVSYNGYMKYNTPTKYLDALDPYDYLAYTWASGASVGGNSYTEPFEKLYGIGRYTTTNPNGIESYRNMKADNIQKKVYDDSFSHNHDLSITGGTEKTKVLFAVNYTDEDGMKLASYYKRANVSLKVNQKIAKNVDISLDTRYTNTKKMGDEGVRNGSGSVLSSSYRFRPIATENILGDLNAMNEGMIENYAKQSQWDRYNPVNRINDNYSPKDYQALRGILSLNWEIVKGLTYHSDLSLNQSWNQNKTWTGAIVNSYMDDNTGEILYAGNAELEKSNKWGLRWSNTLNYDFSLGKAHRFSILAGHEVSDSGGDGLKASGTYYPANFTKENAFAMINQYDGTQGVGQFSSSVSIPGRILSFFSRLNYNLLDRYLLTVTFRADGSSKFSPNNRWGYFPAAALGWRMSEESFLKNQKWIDFLKLRASWGKLGNDQVAASDGFASISTGNSASGVFGNATIPGYQNNTYFSWLKWEVVEEWNAGINFITLNNRLNIDVDYYHRMTNNAVIAPLLPFSTTTLAGNYGKILNSGIDVSVDWNDRIGKDFSYNIGVNISTLRNRVKDLNGNSIIRGGKTVNIVGKEMNSFYGFKMIGVYQTEEEIAADPIAVANGCVPGDLKYADLDGNNVLDGNDRTTLGSYIPNFTYGINLGLNYKNLDFQLTTYGQAGAQMFNRKRALRYSSQNYNFDRAQYEKRWTGPGSTNSNPSAAALLKPWNVSDQKYSSYFVESADYFRIQNITLGYTFRNLKFGNYTMPGLRLSLTADRPFTTFKANAFSPELSDSQGWDTEVYPLTSTYTLGLKIDF